MSRVSSSPFRSGDLEERRARVEAEIRALDADDVDLVIAQTAHARRARRRSVALLAAAMLGLAFGSMSPRRPLEDPGSLGSLDEVGSLQSMSALCERTSATMHGELAACNRRIDTALATAPPILVYGDNERALRVAFAGAQRDVRDCTPREVHVNVTVRATGTVAAVGIDPAYRLTATEKSCIELHLHRMEVRSWRGDSAQVELSLPVAPLPAPPRPID